jgi:hypothetical protein
LVVFSKSLVDVKIQKNRRFLKNSNTVIKFGDYAFISLKETKIELIQLSFIKKFFKKLMKKKRKKNSIGNSNNNKSIKKNYKI